MSFYKTANFIIFMSMQFCTSKQKTSDQQNPKMAGFPKQDLCDLWVMGIYGDSNQEY